MKDLNQVRTTPNLESIVFKEFLHQINPFWRIFISSNNLSQFDEDNSCGLEVDALVMLMLSSPPYYKTCKTF